MCGIIKLIQVYIYILRQEAIYNENEIDEMIMLIRDSFIPAFLVLKDVLVKKLKEAESDWV